MSKEINKKIPITFHKLNSYETEDTRFMRVKIFLMHTGKNFNGSYFSKEVVQEAIPTLANTPILAYIEKNSEGENDFSDHRQVLVKEDGNYKIKYIGQAIGVIPETNNAQFEMRMCDDGLEREFLTVEGLIWQNKWDDAPDILARDSVKAQSMELHDEYEGEWGEDNLFHFTKFKFYGACGLGLDVLPAMINSTIEVQYTLDQFTKEIQDKVEEFKLKFSLDLELDKTNFNNITLQKGGMTVEEKQELLNKYNLTVEQLDFSIDELTVEELENKLKEFKGEEKPVEETPKEEFEKTEEVTPVEESPVEPQFDFNTISEKFKKFYELSHDEVRSKIYSKLSPIEEQDNEWFYISKVYDTYFVYENDLWSSDELKVYKQSYVKTDNDIAFSGERCRLYRMDLTEEEKQSIDMMRTNYSTLENEVATLKEDNKNLSKQLSSYQIKEVEGKKEEVYSLFSDAFSEDEMKVIKTETENIDLDNLENVLYTYVGKKKYKFSRNEKKDKSVVKITPQDGSAEESPYPALTHIFQKIK